MVRKPPTFTNKQGGRPKSEAETLNHCEVWRLARPPHSERPIFPKPPGPV